MIIVSGIESCRQLCGCQTAASSESAVGEDEARYKEDVETAAQALRPSAPCIRKKTIVTAGRAQLLPNDSC